MTPAATVALALGLAAAVCAIGCALAALVALLVAARTHDAMPALGCSALGVVWAVVAGVCLLGARTLH